jgi:tetratricopeptide (TPR) repeat protein
MQAKRIGILVLFVFVLSLPMFCQDPADMIDQGDELLATMADMETAQKVLSLYKDAADKMDSLYDVYWRISRVLYYIGIHTAEKKDQKSIFSEAVDYAQQAAEMEPEKPDGHYWLGVNHGKVGEVRGVLKSLFLVKPIKKAMNKVIELDRSYEDGGPDRVLGRVYFKLPGFAGGSNTKSLEHLQKSKEYGPDDPVTMLYLAETMLKKKMKDEAKQELETILNKPDDPRWIVDLAQCKVEAQELLNKKFK